MGIGLQTCDNCHHEIGCECKIYAIAPKQLLMCRAMSGYATHVCLHHGQYMRGGLQGHDHMLSDLFSYRTMFDQLIAYSWSNTGCWTMDDSLWFMVHGPLSTFHKIQDIIFCNPTVQARALYLL